MIDSTLVTRFESASAPAVREFILELEERMKQQPGVMIGDCFPLVHSFADGLYIREITMPKGAWVISKIHKKAHPFFLLRGECTVLTEDGVRRLRAPCHLITPEGTKRLLYVHEETVWVTVHRTDSTDLEEIEEEIIAKSFDEIQFPIEVEGGIQ